MEYEVFEGIVDDYKRSKPILFGLEQDEVCSAEQIEDFENMLQIELPKKYKQFLMNFGGGYFGYANVYSLDKLIIKNILTKYSFMSMVQRLFVMSDNFLMVSAVNAQTCLNCC